MFGIKRRRAARLAEQEAARQRAHDVYARLLREPPTLSVAPRRVGMVPELSAPYGAPRATRDEDNTFTDALVTVAATALIESVFSSDSSSSSGSSSNSDFIGGGGDFGGGGSSGDW